MITKTFTASTLTEAMHLCSIMDNDYDVWFSNSNLDVTVKADAETMTKIEASVAFLFAQRQTGLSGCGVHSFYVD